MERTTRIVEHGGDLQGVQLDYSWSTEPEVLVRVAFRLAEYKDTGLTPDEITAQSAELAAYREAEDQGRFKQVVLCKDCQRSQYDRGYFLYCDMFKQYRELNDYCSLGYAKDEAEAALERMGRG